MPTAETNRAQQALLLCEQGQWARALEFAQCWQLEAPAEALALFYEGLALTGLGRFVAAENAYYRALALDARDFKTWANLSALLFEALNQPAEAAKCLAQAMIIDPGNKQGWTNLARIYRCLGRHAQALGCAERALALYPKLVAAHLQRARAAQALHRPETVRAAYEDLARLLAEQFKSPA